MNERSVNVELMAMLRHGMPHCMVFKHCDRFTSGVPDNSISWNGATTWLELKFLRGGRNVHDELGPGQLINCTRLEATTGRCWIVAYQARATETRKRRTLVYRPSFLTGGELPETYAAEVKGAAERLWLKGALHFEGFDHYAVMEIVRQTHVR